MITIIICSANEAHLVSLTANIRDTIGVPYEIVSFDNSNGAKGLCEIYNKGIRQAKYDIMCFIHEDIIIHTDHWGEVLVDLFKDQTIGLAGLAGSTYKSLAPSGFHFSAVPELDLNYCNVKQRFKYIEKEELHNYHNPTDVKLAEVTCIDGVWLCATRTALEQYSFNEGLLKGFHGYDLDLSFGIGRNFRIVVTFDILITHLSEGNFDQKWFREILKVHEKWSPVLPINLAGLSKKQVIKMEKRLFRELFQKMRLWNFGPADLFRVAWYALGSNLNSFRLKSKIVLSALRNSMK